MNNPEMSCSPPLSPTLMYSYDRGLNKSWNLSEYKTPRIYQDPKMQVQKRKWASQKKGQKTDKYVTKKGFYMDYHIKVQEQYPSPSAHNSQEPWPFKKVQAKQEKSKSSKSKSLIKNTYLQQIINEEEKRKKPGVGTYNLQKSIREKEKQIEKMKHRIPKPSEKRYFYEDTEHVSNMSPGAGMYNSHDQVTNLHVNKSDFYFWLKKHKKEYERDRKRDLVRPTAGTYSPLYRSYNTFQMKMDVPKRQLQKKNWFGSDSRFPYTRPDKMAIKQVRPAPSTYETGMNWGGKQLRRKRKSWHEALWKGQQNPSVYKDDLLQNAKT